MRADTLIRPAAITAVRAREKLQREWNEGLPKLLQTSDGLSL